MPNESSTSEVNSDDDINDLLTLANISQSCPLAPHKE